MKKIEQLQYITTSNADNVLEEILETCKAGINWIQLRLKNTSDKDFKNIAIKSKEICDTYNVTLIVNDHVHIAKEINADGIHIGKNDMPVNEARNILGDEKIIGGTANSYNDYKKLVNEGINYVGLGPFAFTKTKKNLSPIVGLKGYKDITEKIKENKLAIVPIVAVGGIITKDVASIIFTGIYGIAISGVVATSMNKRETIAQLKKYLN